MNRIVSSLYLLLCGAYPLLCFQMFEEWNSNVLIPSIPLLAIGAWLFGSTIGLFLFLYIASISFALSQFFADSYTYYVDRAMGIPISLLVVYIFSRLRMNYDGLRETTQRLDERVAERDSELSMLTEQLLNSSEIRRVNRGQELHDGIGQQLTGIQLLNASLATQLEQEENSEKAVATKLMMETCRAHDHIRQIARALFPVKIAQVGLVSALTELAACISEIRLTKILVKELSDVSDIPEPTALQLYRICQESIDYLTTHADADRLEVSLSMTKNHFTLGIAHNGSSLKKAEEDSLAGLIQYRLKQIKGTQTESLTTRGANIIYYNIPKILTRHHA